MFLLEELKLHRVILRNSRISIRHEVIHNTSDGATPHDQNLDNHDQFTIETINAIKKSVINCNQSDISTFCRVCLDNFTQERT